MNKPRIYIYKITFKEVPHYYYGVHKEKKYDDEYLGTPITHKHYWEDYTPQKEILKEFPYTDEGWIEANEEERKLIKPVYKIDPYCLNEACMRLPTLAIYRKNAKLGGKITGEKYSITFTVKSPTGEIITATNVNEFCRIHNLSLGNFYYVIAGKRKSHKGWTLPETKFTGADAISQSMSKEFTIKSPNGEIIKGKNISKFCKENNLSSSHICNVIKGKVKSHKGWTLP